MSAIGVSLRYVPKSDVGLVMVFHDRPLAACGDSEACLAADAVRYIMKTAGLYASDVDIVSKHVTTVLLVVMAVFPLIHDEYEVIDSVIMCKAKG